MKTNLLGEEVEYTNNRRPVHGVVRAVFCDVRSGALKVAVVHPSGTTAVANFTECTFKEVNRGS